MHRLTRLFATLLPNPERTCISPSRTAIRDVQRPSPLAPLVIDRLVSAYQEHGIEPRVLDWGCGYGRDVFFYREQGIDADGYDPCFPESAFIQKPTGTYDIITCLAVLNTIADPKERIETLREMVRFGKRTTHFLILVRDKEEIDLSAEDAGVSAVPLNDGWMFTFLDGTTVFQRGFTRGELNRMAKRAGLKKPIEFYCAGSPGALYEI